MEPMSSRESCIQMCPAQQVYASCIIHLIYAYQQMVPGPTSDTTHRCFLFSSFMSVKRAQQLHVRLLMVAVPFKASLDVRKIGGGPFEGAKAAASERQHLAWDVNASLYSSASASLRDRRESGCQSTFVYFSALLAILPDMGQQLLVPPSGIDLLSPSRATGSAGWLAAAS